MTRCIYCLEKKDDTRFNTEHVVPRAFGTFEGNLVLDCVCTECNDFFGRELDLKLARDTVEGMDRFRWGLKEPSEFKSLGTRTTTRVQVLEDGPMKGVWCKVKPSADCPDLNTEPLPQVGFANHEDGPYEFFLLDHLPSKEDLAAKGYKKGSPLFVRYEGTSFEEAIFRLKELNFTPGDHLPNARPPAGRFQTEFVYTISDLEYRAVTKIGMNYLAYVAGPGFALMPQFNEVRRYIRYAVRPPEEVVSLLPSMHFAKRSTGEAVRGHFIAVERRGNTVIAQLSLLCRLRYLVHLTRAPFALEIALKVAHVFDTEEHRVEHLLRHSSSLLTMTGKE